METIVCSLCGQAKTPDLFSKAQRKKGTERKCMQCVSPTSQVPTSTPRAHGNLTLVNGNTYHIATQLNGVPVDFHLDTGASFSQIDTSLAISLNLKSHLTLIGHSDIGNGQRKYDYLSFAKLSILGVTSEILVKVAPGQPCLLGLDAMVMFDMVLRLGSAQFDITTHPSTDSQQGYRFLHTPDHPIYRRVVPSLGQTQLVPFDQLPPPGPIDTFSAGQAQQVLGMDLGVSYSVRRGSPMFDCGFS